MATARSIISAALRKIGVLASGETPRADEAQDSLVSLNAMLAIWGTDNLLVPRINQEVISATSGAYTLTTRPMRILDSTVSDAGQDYPVSSISREDYFAISSKAQTGRPQVLWWDEKITPVTVYLWPVPDKAYSVTLQRWDPISYFATLDSNMDLPAEYEEALIYNVAIRIAPEFGASVSPEIASVADVGLTAITKYHAEEVPILTTDLAGSIRREYRYNAYDQFRSGR